MITLELEVTLFDQHLDGSRVLNTAFELIPDQEVLVYSEFVPQDVSLRADTYRVLISKVILRASSTYKLTELGWERLQLN